MIFRPLLTEKEVAHLLFAAPAITATSASRNPRQGQPGEQQSAVIGSGMDFADLRGYQSGDDPRTIDWRATARSSRPLVRTFNTDLDRPVYLLIDRRAGMRFGTRVRLKVTQAVRAALWLGGREARAGHDVAGVLLDTSCQWLPRQQGLTGIKQLAERAIEPCPPLEPGVHASNWRKIFASLQQRLPQDCTLLMFSDFSGLSEDDLRLLRSLGQHCETVAVRISDRLEVETNLPANIEYYWGRQRVRIQAAGDNQARWFAQQQQKFTEFLSDEFIRAGITFQQLQSDVETLDEALQ